MASFDELSSQVRSAAAKDEEAQAQINAADATVGETGSQVNTAKAAADQLAQQFAALGAEGTAQRTQAVASRLESLQAEVAAASEGLGSTNGRLAAVAAELAEITTEIQAIQGLIPTTAGAATAAPRSPSEPAAVDRFDPQPYLDQMPVMKSRREMRLGERKPATHGRWVAGGANDRELISGTDDRYSDYAERFWTHLIEPGKTARGLPTATKDVELKFATLMRDRNLRSATLVINNPDGPCEGPYSCDELLPRFLPPGAKLTVYWPSGNRKTYTGSDYP